MNITDDTSNSQLEAAMKYVGAGYTWQDAHEAQGELLGRAYSRIIDLEAERDTLEGRWYEAERIERLQIVRAKDAETERDKLRDVCQACLDMCIDLINSDSLSCDDENLAKAVFDQAKQALGHD